MKVTELIGKAHAFTLNSGATFRIFARQTVKVADSEVSNEMHIAVSTGLIALTEEVNEEVPKNKSQEVI